MHLLTLEQGRITRLDPPLPSWAERAYRAALAVYRRESGASR